jgi:tRNA-dihydrouridine synthase B
MKIGNLHIKEPYIAFAPMEDVSDIVFRKICKRYGASMVYTEFVASDGIIRNVGSSLDKMRFAEEERPIGIQIFGNEEKALSLAAKKAEEFKPDVIDINFGCPVKKIASKGAGSGIMKYPDKMIALTKSVVDAVQIPVSVKTRLGYDENTKNIVEIAERLQDVGIQALCIHGRTKAQLYKGKADWTLIGEVKNNPRMRIPIIGNGDIDSVSTAKKCFDKYGVDGIMIGRAAIGNPWIFREVKEFLLNNKMINRPNIQEKVSVCREHLELSIKEKGKKRGINEMRKHYSNYFKSLAGIKEIRIKLMIENRFEAITLLLDEIREKYSD